VRFGDAEAWEAGEKSVIREEPRQSAPHERDLAKRTKRFALEVMALLETLPCEMAAHVLSRQLLRCATAVGANYRGAKRARSTVEFISKMGLVEEEADECCYWLDLLHESGKSPLQATAPLRQEASELVAIAIASIQTARKRLPANRAPRT